MPLAYLYSRVSTKRQAADGLGLRRQAEDRDKWLATHPELNLTVVEDYTDLGVSGRGKNRTEGKFGLIIDAIHAGKIPAGSHLIVDSLDRITREELIDAHYLVLTIIRAGIIIVTTSDGMVYDRTDKERMMFGLLISLVIVARSSNESDLKSDRGLKNWRMKRQSVENGKSDRPYTRMTPAWISFEEQRNEFILNDHAKTVHRIFELAAQGFGTALIIQHLIKEGYPPMTIGRRKDASAWSRRYITLTLENRAVLGVLALGTKNASIGDKRKLTGQLVENYYPAIPGIHDLWSKVVALREGRKVALDKTRNRRGDFSNLFAGVCRCASCNSAMVINHRQAPSKVSYLRCPERYLSKTCTGGNAYQYQRLERVILDRLEYLLLVPSDFMEAIDNTAIELAEAKAKVDTLRHRISNLVDEGEEEGFSEVRERLALRRSELQATEDIVRQLASRQAASQQSFSTEEYINRVKAKRDEAGSEDIDIRTRARSEMKLSLQRLIKRMLFNPDKSVSVHFNLPSGIPVQLDIPHEGEPVLSGKINDNTTLTWRGIKGGLQNAERLGLSTLQA